MWARREDGDMLKLYENIKENRVAKGWSQSELARRVGYSDKSMISKIEKGVVDLSQSQIKKFADVFGVSMADLFGSVEDTLIEISRKPRKSTRDILYRDDDGNAHIITVVEENDTFKNIIETAKNAINPQKSAEKTENNRLTADEKHLIKLYRAGKYKEIVNLMMEKMP
jgi:transcriptional regulator with XRE-family HTH domain